MILNESIGSINIILLSTCLWRLGIMLYLGLGILYELYKCDLSILNGKLVSLQCIRKLLFDGVILDSVTCLATN